MGSTDRTIVIAGGSWTLPNFLAAQIGAQRMRSASNMELVGYDDLQARSAHQPVMQKGPITYTASRVCVCRGDELPDAVNAKFI